MTSFDGVWSQAEAETFLDAARIPIRLGCHNPAGGLWMLSLWFRYQDGVLQCATSADADVVRFLRENDAVCFEISTNGPPYMGVRGAGTATIAEEDSRDVLGALVDRYLGTREAEMAQWLLADDREEVVIGIEPDRMHTWDFTPRMREIVDDAPSATSGEPTSPKYD